MNPVVHFEMAYEDRDRAAKFYSESFGWKPQLLGEEMGDYVVMQTTETDDKNMVQTPGSINGGMYKKQESSSNNSPSVVISVSNLDEAIKKVEKAGGKLLNGPMDIPGIGNYASIEDTEGNRVGVLQPATR